MPYVKESTKAYGDPNIFLWETAAESAAGELNYRITRLLNGYLKVYGLDYQRLNDAIGALECAKLELYRRLAVPYEDGKMMLNGDVYAPCLVEKANDVLDEGFRALDARVPYEL